MEFTKHFKKMLEERRIWQEWADECIEEPEEIENRGDGTRHFLRRIEACGNRWLRVVVNAQAEPNKAVTAFFDRRLKGKQ